MNLGSGARRRAAGCRGTRPGFSSGLCMVCQTEERPLHFSLSREQPGCISCSASVLCPGGSALPGTAVKGCTPGTINISELSPPAAAPASRTALLCRAAGGGCKTDVARRVAHPCRSASHRPRDCHCRCPQRRRVKVLDHSIDVYAG